MKQFIIAVALLVTVSNTHACSICGCGVSNIYLGLYPNFKKSFLGIRQHYSEYHTQLLNNPGQFSHNFYNQTEVWAGYQLNKKWQLMAFIPYQFNIQNDDDIGRATKNGLGDITVMAQYAIFRSNFSKHIPGKVSQAFFVGAGMKLPTGKFAINVMDSATTLATINNQIGTGSVDFILNGRHQIALNNLTLNSSLQYKIGLANQQGYQFGNKLSINTILSYQIRLGTAMLIPNLGLFFDQIEANKLKGSKILLSDGLNSGTYYTGGYLLGKSLGLELNFNRISLGLNYSNPISQEFAKGQTNMNCKGLVHLTFSF